MEPARAPTTHVVLVHTLDNLLEMQPFMIQNSNHKYIGVNGCHARELARCNTLIYRDG
jgi:hypothetical protein